MDGKLSKAEVNGADVNIIHLRDIEIGACGDDHGKAAMYIGLRKSGDRKNVYVVTLTPSEMMNVAENIFNAVVALAPEEAAKRMVNSVERIVAMTSPAEEKKTPANIKELN